MPRQRGARHTTIPVLTVTHGDDEKSICTSNTGGQTDDSASSNQFAAAAAVTPEKKIPSSPLADTLQTQLELQLSNYAGEIMEDNAKLGVDNPIISNPFLPYDSSETSKEQFDLRSAKYTRGGQENVGLGPHFTNAKYGEELLPEQ